MKERLPDVCPKCDNEDTILVGDEEIEELRSSTEFEHKCQSCENTRVIDAKTLYRLVREDFLS